MRTVLKLGGSLLYDEDGRIRVERIREYADIIRGAVDSGNNIVTVVGGGRAAREFIAAARTLGGSEALCDWLGIRLARDNAELLVAALGDTAYPRVVENLKQLGTAVLTGRVVLMGGLVPGQSTNAVAAMAAETINADVLLNATNVEGVYDRDPGEPGARLLERVTVDELESILAGSGARAGEYKLFDSVAIRIVGRSRIKTLIFDGRDPDNVRRALAGEPVGSVIVHDTRQCQ